MVSSTLWYCISIGIVMIAAPHIMFSRNAVKEYVTSGKKKIFYTVLILLFLLFIMWFGVAKTPQVVNRLYETKTGTIADITGEAPPGSLFFDFKTQRYMKQTKVELYDVSLKEYKWDINGIYAENLKKNDEIKIRKFVNASIVTKKNGKETELYKKYYDEWLGSPVFDKLILILTIFINLIIHIVKFNHKTKENIVCTIFSIVMLISILKPIRTIQEAVYWGYALTVLFVVYQLMDFVCRLKEPEYINIPYPKIRGQYFEIFEINEDEKTNILDEQKEIDYICPNCGGKMTITEDHKYKKCQYCDSVIAFSESEGEDVEKILHAMNIPKADCVETVKKICVEQHVAVIIQYLSGESLTTTYPKTCKKVKEYFHIPEEDEIFFIYDKTLKGSWKYGFAICTSGIYFRQGLFSRAGMYSWEDFKKIQIFAKKYTLLMGRVLFREYRAKSLGRLLLRIQKEI